MSLLQSFKQCGVGKIGKGLKNAHKTIIMYVLKASGADINHPKRKELLFAVSIFSTVIQKREYVKCMLKK